MMRVGHRAIPFTANRRMAAASAAVASGRSTIHGITEVDISRPRGILREHRRRTGETLSLTAYVIACLARAVAEHPYLNAFRRGSKLIVLDDVTISALIERELEGEKIPEPVGIRAAQAKTYRQIHDEIRASQERPGITLAAFPGSNGSDSFPRSSFARSFALPLAAHPWWADTER